MDRDGTGQGLRPRADPRDRDARSSIPVIASGGVGKLADLADGLEAGADAVLAASIFHFGQHTIGEAKAYPRRPRPRAVPSRLETSAMLHRDAAPSSCPSDQSEVDDRSRRRT